MSGQTNTLSISRIVLFMLLAAVLGACGGGSADGDSEQRSSSRNAVPTMPAAQFGATEGEVDLTKVAETVEEPEEGDPDLALGESAYSRLCAECHGANGEGVDDKGSAVAGMNLDADAVEDLLRTGGGLGNDHIFGPSKISNDGIVALSAYLGTLGE